ncbi:hypothetical protein BASA61_008614 [Batrachochytrium salamandrivorans]|nr:hypothetical protein BASA62_004028 [Batrachochytrium salamandrivorans]KAH6578754.1 hypothetical protein BASA60_003527 [Batrachochytrium salamandrivorans]KAH6582210.1 hypothetical protein BASA61_008614 [Batrachochytrium salamandrivorans]KAJ1342613.1 hypothetical protein BSLG_002711 [Batrachochytrium salamandrivorans]
MPAEMELTSPHIHQGLEDRCPPDLDQSISLSTSTRLSSLLAVLDGELDLHARVALRNKGLVERLASFRDSRWPLKPAALSPLICAAHGWINDSTNTLRCPSCCALLLCNVRLATTADTIVQKYIALLKEAHKESCHWRMYVMPEQDYRFPLMSTSQMMHAFRTQIDSLIPIVAGVVVDLSLTGLDDLDGILCAAGHLGGDYSVSTSGSCIHTRDQHRCTASLLAAFGWEGSADSTADSTVDSTAALESRKAIIKCALCLRECGIWMFSVLSDGNQRYSKFDVVSEHFWFCPWIVANGCQTLPGWRITLDKIITKIPK